MKQVLHQLHRVCLKIAALDFKQRLQTLAEFFLGVKYGPWKFGSNIEALDDFNYDLTTLDCVTYAEVVLALLNINPPQDYNDFIVAFENTLRSIHYAQGVPSFLYSNHFFCVDWIANNQQIVQDITSTLWPNTKLAQTQIDRLSWFTRHAINANNTQHFSAKALQRLRTQQSNLSYITTEDLLNNYQRFIEILPECSIITIVRPNWDLRERIGTHLNISHLGFVIKDLSHNNLNFYHATITANMVLHETLDKYMRQHLESPTIRGINVLALRQGIANAG